MAVEQAAVLNALTVVRDPDLNRDIVSLGFIKNLTIETWTGDKWSKDPWDTGRGDWRNRLPKLVRITIEAYAKDYEENDPIPEDQQPTETMTTVVIPTESWEYTELKEQDKTVRWENL